MPHLASILKYRSYYSNVHLAYLGIAAMRLDDDFKNNISKHAQLLFAVNLLYGKIR
jgi:hypothetical protein